MRDEEAGLPIGEALKRARTRQQLDIRTAEEQTKIRIKYLRALENEEWDLLPGHPYAKGFLRTYAHFLGLDGDALVDEYRRTVESSLGAGAPFPFTEPVLEHRRRPGEETSRRWPIRASALIALAAAALVAIVILGVASDSGHERKHHHHGRGGHQHHHAGGGGPSNSGQASSTSPPVTVSLVTRDDMLVCLVPGHGRPLIDSQTLIAGSQEGPFQPPAKNYRLDLESGGAVTLTLNGKRTPVSSKAPASFEIDSSGVRPTQFAGPNCP